MRVPLRDRIEDGFMPEPNSGCWLWLACVSPEGYGAISVGNHKTLRAHRYVYEKYKGPIPEGLHLDHLCRTPSCVNPDHLEPVTNRENMLRGNHPFAKRAAQTHCKRGHEFTPENTRVNRSTQRECKECTRVRCRDRKRRLVAARRTANA